jgi:hypothetical protein
MAGPPVEERVSADEVGLLLEDKAALRLDLLQRGQIGEAHVGQGRIGQRPQMLRRLQFGGIGRQGDQVDALRERDGAGVPARAVEHERDAPPGTGSHVPGKGGEHLGEGGSGDRGQEPPLGLAGAGPDEAADVEPLVALLHRGDGPPSDRCPDASNKREQADTMLISGPELDLGAPMGGGNGLYGRTEVCLKAAWAAGSAS